MQGLEVVERIVDEARLKKQDKAVKRACEKIMVAKIYQELIKRHLDFWDRREVEEPIINIDCSGTNRFGHIPSIPKEWRDKDGLILEPKMLSPGRFPSEPKTSCKSQPPVCGPIFNTVFPYFRVVWLPAIAGCQLQISTAADTIWPLPFLDEHWYEKEDLTIPIDRKWLDKLCEFTSYLVVNYHPHQYIVVQDQIARGPGDLLANILGDQNMILGMYDHPDKIKKLLSRLTDIYLVWARAQFELIPPFEGGYCNQYGLWAPGTSIRFQEDLAINLSPELFKEFLLPCHQKIVESFEYQVLHTHSGFSPLAEWVLENKDLKAIEVCIDRNGPEIEDLLPLWKKIQTQKPLILEGLLSEKELHLILSELSPRGLFLDIDIVEEDQLNIADFYARQLDL